MRHIGAIPRRVVAIPARLVLIGIRPILSRFDTSERLSNLINSLSSSMATQRGLLLMLGAATVLASLVAHAVVLIVLISSGSLESELYLLCIPFGLFHIGVLTGFTGAMLATPLGQGYKDK